MPTATFPSTQAKAISRARCARQSPDGALWATDYLRRDLLAGTTTLRVMAAENLLELELRAAIDADTILGPRLLCAVRGITASNG